MRGGETGFNHILLVVAQDIKKYMLLNDSGEFVYQLNLDGLTEEKITHDEHVQAVKLLQKRRLIEVKQLRDDDGPGDRINPYTYDSPTLKLSVRVNTVLLDEFIGRLGKTTDNNDDRMFSCQLYLNDIELGLAIDDERVIIGRLHDGRDPHKLLVALMNPVGTTKRAIEIFPNNRNPEKINLWQIITKARYGYLKPFFERPTNSKMALHREVKLPKAELRQFVPKINAKYRKNFEATLNTL